VIGEAEGVWEQLLQDFLAGKMKKRYQRDTPHNLVGLRKPRLDLAKKEAYSTPNVMETARGCPHRCAYCAVSLFWGYRYRFRPVQEVIDEIRSMPPGAIVFIDDNIIGLPSRAKELFKAMIPLKRKWYSQADLKLARYPELLELCAKSGCQWLFMGIESINRKNLEDVGKSRVNKVEEYQESIRTIQDAGINVFGSFIFGLDHDDKTVFDNTVQFCMDNRLPAANFYILVPLPFTRVFEKMEEEGRILHRDWSRYDGNHVVFRPMLMTPNELLEGYLYAYRSLYSIRSIVKRTPGPRRDISRALALNVGRRLNYRYFEEGCR
ncbi:MAG: radical SAM protein, partial [Deltaproteobacteria bacterium]